MAFGANGNGGCLKWHDIAVSRLALREEVKRPVKGRLDRKEIHHADGSTLVEESFYIYVFGLNNLKLKTAAEVGSTISRKLASGS